MNTAQIIYALALAGVFLWRGPSYGAWVLLANMAATLAACLALDMGMERQAATLTMMLIDFMAGAALLCAPGLPRLLAVGYAVTIPVYAGNIMFGLSEYTTFAIVVAVGFVQIAVAGIGTGGNDRGAGHRRPDGLRDLAPSRGIAGLGIGGLAARRASVPQDSR